MRDQLDEYDLEHLLEQEGVQYATPAFLDQADAPLYLWHVFFCCCGVHDKDGYVVSHLYMYRTNVLMYCTMVQLAHQTKVRC